MEGKAGLNKTFKFAEKYVMLCFKNNLHFFLIQEDMESRSVPLEESKQQVTVLPEKEANLQTQLQTRYRLSFLWVKPA